MSASPWAWRYTGPKGIHKGYVQAENSRDAAAQAIASLTPTGKTFGEEHGIPIDFVDDIAARESGVQYVKAGWDFVLSVEKVTCPSHRRHAADLVGCGSDHLAGPDEEGLFDCCDCGLFFNPLKEAQSGCGEQTIERSHP